MIQFMIVLNQLGYSLNDTVERPEAWHIHLVAVVVGRIKGTVTIVVSAFAAVLSTAFHFSLDEEIIVA